VFLEVVIYQKYEKKEVQKDKRERKSDKKNVNNRVFESFSMSVLCGDN
jgi:hypothetical protein